MEPKSEPNRTQTIAVNSFWYGSETLIGFVLLFGTSIPLARIMGPEKLGYFNYIAWLTAMTASLGALGMPAMTLKFIAEYLGRNEKGVVRAIFFRSLQLQLILATSVTVLSLAILLVWGDPRYRLVSTLQVLSVLPGMVASIPSIANVAQERMSANFAGSMVSGGIYLVGVLLSLWLGWGLVGVAGSFLLGRVLEMIIRMVPCVARIRTFPHGSIAPPLARQMKSFAQKQVVLLVLGLVIWDRSDILLLKMLASDIKQVTFFSLVFNIIERLLLLPRVFGGAMSASVMVQYGRDSAKMKELTAAGTRYMLLLSIPLLSGVALVSPSLIRVMYGSQYTAAIPVLAIAALFAIMKSVFDPANSVLEANNRQGPAVVCAICCAVLNVGLDWLLIPSHGAIGAAIGNGVAQATLVISYWVMCTVMYRIPLDFKSAGKIVAAACSMILPVMLLAYLLPPLLALAAGVIAGAATFVSVLALLSFFQSEDYARLGHLGDILPRVAQPPFRAILHYLIPASPPEGLSET